MKGDEEEDRTGYVLAALIVAAFIVLLLAACSTLKVEGGCTYERTIETRYTCEPGSALEHTRIAPGIPEP